jgi:hypothetical protein
MPAVKHLSHLYTYQTTTHYNTACYALLCSIPYFQGLEDDTNLAHLQILTWPSKFIGLGTGSNDQFVITR